VLYRLSIDAFPLTQETESACAGLTGQREFSRARVAVHSGGLTRAVKHYVDNPSPQVIIVEEAGGPEEIQKGLEALAEVVEPGRKVIVIGAVNDVQAYRRLISQGVSEYLVAPVSSEDVAAAIIACVKDPSATPRGRAISFIGARGGVGTSTLAVNMAWTLAELTQETVIGVDLDLNSGTMALSLNLDPRQSVAEALTDPDRIDTVLVERIMMEHGDNLSVLSTAGSLKEMTQPSPEAVERLIDMCRTMAAYVVVDLPRRWNAWVAGTLTQSDEVVVVASPDLANLRDAKQLTEWLRAKRGNASPRLVLSKADAAKRNQLSAKDFQETLGIVPSLSVGFDATLFAQLMNNGQMIAEGAKGHKLNEHLRQFARQLGAKKGIAKSGGKGLNLMSWLKRPKAATK
jgi:pilus assembly protein CpaE